MKYCKTTTQNHRLYNCFPTCCIKMRDVISREKGRGNLFSDEIVLDLDAIETSLARRDHRSERSTMDVAFGYSQQDQVRQRITKQQMCLVEFKYDVKSGTSINKNEFIRKVEGAKAILTQDIPIHNNYYFVYPERFKNEATHYLRRLFGIKTTYIAIDNKDLLNMM